MDVSDYMDKVTSSIELKTLQKSTKCIWKSKIDLCPKSGHVFENRDQDLSHGLYFEFFLFCFGKFLSIVAMGIV